jgi:multidrug efflux pump subunit AcrA (membrane-fusion protein)
MQSLHKHLVQIGVAVVLVLGIGVGTALVLGARTLTSDHSSPSPLSDDEETNSGPAVVKVIRPRSDPTFQVSVKEPATINPYYVSELDAQIAGSINFLRVAEGASVKAGSLLAKIDVPELDEQVALKAALVEQQAKEVVVAEKNVLAATAAVEAAINNIAVKKAEVEVAKSDHLYRENQYQRLKKAIRGDSPGATTEIVEEAKQRFLTSVADVTRAENAVLKAQSDLAEAQAKLDAAKADVELKKANVHVAEKDRDKAQARADYAQVKSLYNGQVKRRHVDPGAFMRIGEPVLTVERTDIVTVSVKVPDTFAPYVTADTEVIIEMSELPGQEIHGKVTRWSPSLLNKDNDHTMLVEVDLFNCSEAEYQQFLAAEKAKKVPFDDLKEGPLPLLPVVKGPGAAASAVHLIPGMYGDMRLVFEKLPNLLLIPSDAIVYEGGTPYLYLVQKGKVHRQQVDVQMDTQSLAKVALIDKTGKKRKLTGEEEIAYSHLSELAEGETVQPILQDWKPRD